MLLLNLILILLIGGAIAWWSERLGTHLPRLIAVFVVLIDLAYLLNYLAGIPLEQLSVVPDAADPSSWLLAYQLDWIPRFGISFQLAMDGLSLVLILLTLVLGVIAIISSWNERERPAGIFSSQYSMDSCWSNWCIPSDGSIPVLPILGSNAGSNVSANRNLGPRRQSLRVDEVFYIHAIQWATNAISHPCACDTASQCHRHI